MPRYAQGARYTQAFSILVLFVAQKAVVHLLLRRPRCP